MFKIYDGREKFYQWDLDRRLVVEDPSVTEVHFCNRTDSCSLVCETFVEDGLTLVNVPNILLQTNWKIHVYAYDGSYTKHEECYEVKSRTKPSDYVYEETVVKTWDELEERITQLEQGGFSDDELEKAIGDYLTENPVEVDLSGYATKEEVAEKLDETEVKDILAGQVNLGYVTVNPGGRISTPSIHITDGYPSWGGLVEYDENGNYTTMEETLATKANEMKLLYKKKITADDGNVSFIEFLPEAPLKKVYIYTYCPKHTTANTNKLFFKFGNGTYVTDSIGHANIATDSAMWGIKEFDLEQHKHIAHANNIKTGYPGSLQSRNNLYPYSGSNTYWTAIYDTLTFEVINLLNGIKFSTNSDSVYFPIETIVMIWGC